MPTRKIYPRLFFLAFAIVIFSWQSTAQENRPIVLTVQLFEGLDYLSNGTTFTDFEAAHPDVSVNVVYKRFSFDDAIYPPGNGFQSLEEYFGKVDKFTAEADILVMSVGEDIYQLSLEATRAGYILDLAPLFNTDSTADPSVYYPTVWQTAQWDGGLWILPMSANVYSVVYDGDAFDAAGLEHPDETWTANDFANAAEVLAVRDPSGNIIEPSFIGQNGSGAALAYRFLEQPLYDSNQFPYIPQFTRPDALELANQWLPALATGAMFNYQFDYGHDLNLDHVSLAIDRLSIATLNGLEFAPLPGGGGQVNIKGLVVSSRTEYPQLAYELASFLAADIRVADALNMSWGGMSLARPEYPDVVAIRNAPYGLDSATEESRLIINDALVNGVPASELLYYPYFQNALFLAAANDLDIETALRDAEILAINNLEAAEAQRSEISGTIPTPVPEIALAPNEIELTFYHEEGDTLLWQAFAEEFTAADPEVGRVILQSPYAGFDYTEEGTDCFYANGSLAQSGTDYLVDITPLIAVDSDFDAEDWLTGVFDSLQEGDSIYALPIDIRPLALWYEPSQLEAAGLQAPQSYSEFMDALDVLGDGSIPAVSSYELGSSLLMLLAAEGAVPIHYEANAIRLDFTSDANLAAIQQILDLAREGKIKYGSLLDFTSSDGFPDSEAFIIDTVAFSWFRDAAYRPQVFPAGSHYTPVSYSTMAAYISRFSQYPEACYRFIRSLSHHPELVFGLAAQRVEAMPSDYASFYDDFNQQLNAPNLLFISNLYSDENYYTRYWLFQAFDHYVLEDADLLAELTTAEQLTNEYLACVAAGDSPRDCGRS